METSETISAFDKDRRSQCQESGDRRDLLRTSLQMMMKEENCNLQKDLIKQACKYIMERTYPEGCTQSRKKQIRKKAEKFRMVNGELCYASRLDKKV